MPEWLSAIDKSLFIILNRDIANPLFDWFFPLVTARDFWIIPALVVIPLFVACRRRQALVAIALVLITVAITDPLCVRVIKELVHRHRPCDPCCLIEGGRFLLGHKHSLSFPSAHAMNTFGAATVLGLLYPKRWLWFLSFAIMIGYSRIYVGVHYPVDVAAGAVLGAAIGAAVYFSYDTIRRRIVRRGRDRAAKGPGVEGPPPGPPAATQIS